MKKAKFGFIGWKALSEVFCGVMLAFSFVGKADLPGNLYYILLFFNLVLIALSTFMLIVTKRLEN
jgi:hypothetical protein